MALKVAKRGGVPPFIVMDVMSAAAAREQAPKLREGSLRFQRCAGF